MAQTVSPSELKLVVRAVERVKAAHPESALAAMVGHFVELVEVTAESETAAATAGAALSAVVASVRAKHPRGIPENEQGVWARVGARFDEGAVPVVEALSAAAFSELVERSVRGDGAAAERLHVDRSRISQRLSDRSLYAFAGPGEERCFPEWQFHGDKTLPGLKTVLSSVDPARHPLSIDHWFTHPNVDLDVDGRPSTPVEWLATGGAPATVAELAADL